MRVLLDECVPKRIKNQLKTYHQVSTIVEQGWSGKKNGELLRLAVLLVISKDNKFETIRKFVPKILKTLSSVKSGEFVRITALSGHRVSKFD